MSAGVPSNLVPFEEAFARLLSRVVPLDAEVVPVAEAVGRTLVDAVLARRTVPPWDNSAMDGYAVRSEDTRHGVSLRVGETVFAGSRPRFRVEAGGCARIMTGAPLPEGADAVVMQEQVHRAGDAIRLEGHVSPGTNVRRAGEDARQGDLLLGPGTALGIPEAGLLWAQGLTDARVPRRPRVGILSTGDELCGPEEEPGGRIVDINGPSLALAVTRAGAVPVALGIARDDVGSIVEHLRRAGEVDVLLTSAGVSVGEKDFVREALLSLGATLDVWKVAMKPGKPLCVGRLGRTLLFGLPGNPTSSLVGFELFVRPALRRMLGHADVTATVVPARTRVALPKLPGLRQFVRVTAAVEGGEWWCSPLNSQSSGALRSAAGATHLAVLREEQGPVRAGDPVGLISLSWIA